MSDKNHDGAFLPDMKPLTISVVPGGSRAVKWDHSPDRGQAAIEFCEEFEACLEDVFMGEEGFFNSHETRPLEVAWKKWKEVKDQQEKQIQAPGYNFPVDKLDKDE